MISVVIVARKENCPSTTRNRPGRRKSSPIPVAASTPLAMKLAKTRIEMPRITPGITSGTIISR